MLSQVKEVRRDLFEALVVGGGIRFPFQNGTPFVPSSVAQRD